MRRSTTGTPHVVKATTDEGWRLDMALTAAVELDTLRIAVGRAIGDQDNDVTLPTFWRGVNMRMEALTGVILSVLGEDDNRGSEEMADIVYGEWVMDETAHAAQPTVADGVEAARQLLLKLQALPGRGNHFDHQAGAWALADALATTESGSEQSHGLLLGLSAFLVSAANGAHIHDVSDWDPMECLVSAGLLTPSAAEGVPA